ncbi:MAG TPA: ankyrin repeat domain-containing protein [Gammaproteobacteria bacterium]|nr:ankyrin repeat domain-containing protein [Gammaproteobacteria bacterium]
MNNANRERRRLKVGTIAVLSYAVLLGLSGSAAAASLATAARNGDVNAVRAQLAAGKDANEQESDGSSALLWAAYQSSPELIALLLESGADPNLPNEFGVTPLLQASRNGDVATMRALLDGGADADRAVRDGETPLMAAARTGNAEAVALLLTRGSDANAAESLEGQTALMWAVAEGHAAVVDELLRAGADPNSKARVSGLTKRSTRTDFPSGGFTALMWAARDGQEAMVRRLIDAGADVKLTNGDGSTAMMLAIVNDRFDMAATLLELGADANDGSLWYALEMRDAPTDWRARDGSRLRPDHPNKLSSLDLIERLLAAGADPNKPFTGQMHNASMCCDTKGSGTPFYRAAVASDVDAMRLLIARGADLEWAPPRVEGAPPPPFGDTTGLTPLMVTINGGRGLLMAGGPGDIRESKIGTFREPGDRDPANAVKLLLEAGAKPNSVNPNGDTALHIAAHDGKLGPLRELVAGGADVNARNKAGQTALQLVETMQPRVLNPIAEMVGIFDDGASPKETAAYLRELLAAKAR